MKHRHPIDALLTLGATARLTRLVTADDWGQWFIRAPIYEAVLSRTEEEDKAFAANMLSGLTCPHCVGFWIGAGVLLVDAVTEDTRLARPWRFTKAALALNALVVPLGKAVDYWE